MKTLLMLPPYPEFKMWTSGAVLIDADMTLFRPVEAFKRIFFCTGAAMWSEVLRKYLEDHPAYANIVICEQLKIERDRWFDAAFGRLPLDRIEFTAFKETT